MMTPVSQTQVTIRPMQEGDLEQVQAIDRLSFSLPWPESAFCYELKENTASLQWVAEAVLPDGSCKVVGLLILWLILDEAHVATIAVHPDYRRQGIAQRLLAQSLRAAVERKCITATLEVRAGNRAAQDLYRRFRFEIVGRRLRYYKDNNEDALIMTLAGLEAGCLEWINMLGGC